MQWKCFENVAILCHRLSFVTGNTIRQANDIHSMNAIKLCLELNTVKHWLCVNVL